MGSSRRKERRRSSPNGGAFFFFSPSFDEIVLTCFCGCNIIWLKTEQPCFGTKAGKGEIRIGSEKRINTVFFSVLAVMLALHLVCVFLPFFLPDEAFYISIPYRLTAGDSLFTDEWHLSQLSSLFSFVPVKAWLMITKSTDGLLLFLRLVFLGLHTAATALIYRLFREYGYWAIVSATIYCLQTPYKLYALSYYSMFALFLLLFSLSLLLICKNGLKRYTVFAGICYAACCVSNPPFAVTAAAYPVLYILHKRRRKTAPAVKAAGKAKTKQGAVRHAERETRFDCFFNGRSVLFFLYGAASVAVLALVFFFATGGSAASAAENVRDILNSSEYSVFSGSLFEKLKRIAALWNGLFPHVPFLVPLLYVVLLFDRGRKKNAHRTVYLSAAVLLSFICIYGMRNNTDIAHSLFVALPFFLLSTVSYILTENKNKTLFCCMFCPCAAAGHVNLFFANSLLTSANIAIAVADVAGVIFARDLFSEMKEQNSKKARGAKPKHDDRYARIARGLICAGCAVQLVFYVYVMLFGQPFTADPVTVKDGPYAGMVMSGEGYADYRAALGDLDVIRERSDETDPLLIVSYRSWMYLYAQRPIAAYTVWYDAALDTQAMQAYYRHNPDKLPKYVYLVYSDSVSAWGAHADGIDNVSYCMDAIDALFDYEKEALSNGYLLTVTAYHPDGGGRGADA